MNRLLSEAVLAGDAKTAHRAATGGADNIDDACRRAIARGSSTVIDVLLPLVANVDEVVLEAIYNTNLEVVTSLDRRVDWDRVLLMAAERGCHIGAIEFAIKRGARRINEAFKIAAIKGDLGACQVFAKCTDSRCVLNYEEFMTLIKNGYIAIACMFANDDYYTENYTLWEAAKHGHIKLVQHLIDRGAQGLNVALYHATKYDHVEVASLLIDRGADNLNTALYYAAKYGNVEIVQLLIDRGADNLNTALYYAATYGNAGTVQLLIDCGANNLNTALYYAVMYGNAETVRLLIDRGARV